MCVLFLLRIQFCVHAFLYRRTPCSSFARRNVSETRAADSIMYCGAGWMPPYFVFMYRVMYVYYYIYIRRRNAYGEQKLEDLKERPPFVWRPDPSKAFVSVLYAWYTIMFPTEPINVRKHIEQIDKSRIFAETRTLIRSLKPLKVGIACVRFVKVCRSIKRIYIKRT